MNEKPVAELMAKDMREISIAEFFEKNKHFLGYENPTKSLVTVVKEAVDNALEFTCEAGILPEIKVTVKEVSESRFKIEVEDNGPGIIEKNVPNAFGRVLYGSRFHKLKQSRSLFGIGIKGACLYSQLTTGRPVRITSSIGRGPIHIFELMINVAKNEPVIISHKTQENPEKWHGIKIEMEVEGRYIERGHSILEYLKRCAMVNPYATIIFNGPDKRVVFKRVTNVLPKKAKEIKPHPYGVELGVLRRMLSSTKAKSLTSFLTTEFSRIGKTTADKICRLAKIDPVKNPKNLNLEEVERLHKAMQVVKVASPPTDCLSPIGEELLEGGLKKETKADWVVAVTRSPQVYRGYPFQVECAIAYGGELEDGREARLLRFANKVPLFYHQSDCVITKAVKEVDWRRYGLSQPQGQFPIGPVAILVHFASVWIPFTSEGKQAIAEYPEIKKEIKLALQDAGRKLGSYVRKIRRLREKQIKRQIFERYIPEVAEALGKLTDKDKNLILNKLREIVKKKLGG